MLDQAAPVGQGLLHALTAREVGDGAGGVQDAARSLVQRLYTRANTKRGALITTLGSLG